MHNIIPIEEILTIRFNENVNITKVKYGLKELTHISYEFNKDLSFNSIEVSEDIIAKLHLNSNNLYHIRINDNILEFGPLIGLLLGHNTMKYTPEYMEKYLDRFTDYKDFCGTAVAFSIDSINYKESIVYGLVYDYKSNSFKYSKSPIPEFIYRRDFSQSQYSIDRLKEVATITNEEKINKSCFNRIISKSRELKGLLPVTIPFSNTSLIRIIKDKDVILKPTNLSRGAGIIVIRRDEEVFNIFDYADKKNIIKRTYEDIEDFIADYNHISNYIIQELIELDKYNNSKYDIRVVVQKNTDGSYFVNGIEARLAKSGEQITNVALGGDVKTIEEVLEDRFDYEYYKKFIERISILTAEHFNKYFNVIELGIDIGISEEGKVYLIEANSLPSFKGFKRLEERTYLRIRKHILKYNSDSFLNK